MTEQLTPELTAAFEAMMDELGPRGVYSRWTILDLMLKAYNLDKWVDVKTPPETSGKVLITDGVVRKTAYFDTDRNRWQISGFKITVTYWQTLPAAPIPSHTITKGEEGL